MHVWACTCELAVCEFYVRAHVSMCVYGCACACIVQAVCKCVNVRSVLHVCL